jgi:hypothetical protein
MIGEGGPTNAPDPANSGELTDDQLDALLDHAGQELLHYTQAHTDPTATLAKLLATQSEAEPGNDPPLAAKLAGKPARLRRSRRAGGRRPSWRTISIAAVAAAAAVTGIAAAAATISTASHPQAAPNTGVVAAAPPVRSATGPSLSPAPLPPVQTAQGPAATVTAYFAAINKHDYRRAWKLGGDNSGLSYRAFTAGFAGTTLDIVHILHVRGNVVTVDLTAELADGTKKSFTGTYTITNGAIKSSSVLPART